MSDVSAHYDASETALIATCVGKGLASIAGLGAIFGHRAP
jgi:hypothetical protein